MEWGSKPCAYPDCTFECHGCDKEKKETEADD